MDENKLSKEEINKIREENNNKKSTISELKEKAMEKLAMKKKRASTEHVVEAIKLLYEPEVIRSDNNKNSTPEIYVYNNGIYEQKGISTIGEFTRSTYKGAFTKELLNEIITKITYDKECTIDQEEFFKDKHKHLLPLQNGVYNIQEKKLINYNRTYKFFTKIPVEYKEGQDCPEIKKFIHEVLGGEEEAIMQMQEFIGYLLLREYRYEKLVMMLGKGSNGKTRLIELLTRFIGKENTSSVTLKALSEDQYSAGLLFGKYANLAGDIGNEPIHNSDVIKALTGGDQISANRKHMSHLKFQNHAKLVFACNELPPTYDDSHGWWRRWLFFQFPIKYVKKEVYEQIPVENKHMYGIADPDIMDKISTREELSGLLNWGLEGLHRLIDNKGFTERHSTDKLRHMWKKESNSFYSFITECFEHEYDAVVKEDDLMQWYSVYCKIKRQPVASKKTFNYVMQELGFAKNRLMIDGERDFYWCHLKIPFGEKTERGRYYLKKIDDFETFIYKQNPELPQLPRLDASSHIIFNGNFPRSRLGKYVANEANVAIDEKSDVMNICKHGFYDDENCLFCEQEKEREEQ